MDELPWIKEDNDRLDALIEIEERHGVSFTSPEIDSRLPLAEMEQIAAKRAAALRSIPAIFRG